MGNAAIDFGCCSWIEEFREWRGTFERESLTGKEDVVEEEEEESKSVISGDSG